MFEQRLKLCVEDREGAQVRAGQVADFLDGWVTVVVVVEAFDWDVKKCLLGVCIPLVGGELEPVLCLIEITC